MISLIREILKQQQQQKQLIVKGIRFVAGRGGGLEEGGQKLQTSSYKINKH